jgi:hypothetical protein
MGAFSGVQANYYWSSSTDVNNTSKAWCCVRLSGGNVLSYKSNPPYVWPVRGGQ